MGGGIDLYQGYIELKAGNSASVQLDGIDNSSFDLPTNLGAYNGSLFWQDRRNSTLLTDALGNLDGTQPCNVTMGGSACTSVPSSLSANGVTSSSPGFVYDAAVPMALSGSLYQARGAWFSFQGTADISSGLTIYTGMVHMTGNGQVSLLPNATPTIKYRVALIH